MRFCIITENKGNRMWIDVREKTGEGGIGKRASTQSKQEGGGKRVSTQSKQEGGGKCASTQSKREGGGKCASTQNLGKTSTQM